MRGADEEVPGNVNQELLRIDDDNDHMGQLFWGDWAIFAGKILKTAPKNCLSNLTKQHAVNERKPFKL